MSLYNDKVIKAAIQEIGSLLSKTTLSEAERKKLLAGKINYILNYETARYVAQQEELINECITQGLTLDLVTAQHKFFVNSDITMEVIASSSDAMNEIVNSEIAMNEIVNSETAVNKCINSSTAMEKILNSQYRDLFLDSSYLDPNNAADATARETVRNWLLSNPDIFGDGSIIAWYPFDNNGNDSSGNNHDGVWNGTEQYELGLINQAASFNGSSYFKCTGVTGTDTKSISFWMKPSNLTDQQGLLSFNDYDLFFIHSTYHNFAFNNNGSWINGIELSFENRFYHVVVDFTSYKVFLDGSVSLNNGTALALPANDLYLATDLDAGSPSDYFVGLIDSVRIFNRALTDTEIQRLYKLEMLARN